MGSGANNLAQGGGIGPLAAQLQGGKGQGLGSPQQAMPPTGMAPPPAEAGLMQQFLQEQAPPQFQQTQLPGGMSPTGVLSPQNAAPLDMNAMIQQAQQMRLDNIQPPAMQQAMPLAPPPMMTQMQSQQAFEQAMQGQRGMAAPSATPGGIANALPAARSARGGKGGGRPGQQINQPHSWTSGRGRDR